MLLVVFTLLPAAIATSRLEIRPSLSELLPESRPSVQQLERVRHRVASASTLIVVLEGGDVASLERAVDALTPKLRGLGPELVGGVDAGTREARRFVEQHKLLYADLSVWREVRDRVAERYEYEVGKRMGFDLGLTDEAPPPIQPEEIRQRLASASLGKAGRDYYLDERARLAAIVVRTPLEAGDPRTFELEQRIRQLWAAAKKEHGLPELRINFTGNLVTSAEEHRAIKSDLAHVGAAGVTMILAIVFLFFLRLRAIVAIGLTIGVACLWSFAFAYLAVGHLNSATGFLVSIIAGDGINFGVVLTARYLEARLRDGATAVDAVRVATTGTAAGTLTAALCSSVAYGSLAATDFRGFRHFGIIAGVGMVFCWIATFTLLPALLVLGERFRPIRDEPRNWKVRLRGLYGRPFAFIARRASRGMLVPAVVSGLVCAVVAGVYLVRDPLEYDMRRLRVDDSEPTSARVLARRVEKLLGRFERDGQALLVDRIDQLPHVVRELERRRDAAPRDQKPFERTVTVLDVLPKDQPEKLAIAREVLQYAERATRLGLTLDPASTELQRQLSALRPIGISDLPSALAWPFEERDGTRGRIVYLVPAEGRSLNDARYLLQFAEAFREVRLPNSETIIGTGDPVLFADMLGSIKADAPRALVLAFAGTMLVIVVAFRGARAGWLALASFVLGFLWLLGYLALAGERINFLNFVALPISVGIGADYAVNVMKRLELEGAHSLPRVLEETGGAVVLCSLTTLLGYAALLLSVNGAVRSFGRAAAAGELTMLLSAMLILPATLVAGTVAAKSLHEAAKSRRSGATPAPRSSAG